LSRKRERKISQLIKVTTAGYYCYLLNVIVLVPTSDKRSNDEPFQA